MIYLLITGILIFTNWSTWIYAVVTNKIIDCNLIYLKSITSTFGWFFLLKLKVEVGMSELVINLVMV